MFVAMSQKYVKIFGPAQIIYSALTFSQAGTKAKRKADIRTRPWFSSPAQVVAPTRRLTLETLI